MVIRYSTTGDLCQLMKLVFWDNYTEATTPSRYLMGRPFVVAFTPVLHGRSIADMTTNAASSAELPAPPAHTGTMVNKDEPSDAPVARTTNGTIHQYRDAELQSRNHQSLGPQRCKLQLPSPPWRLSILLFQKQWLWPVQANCTGIHWHVYQLLDIIKPSDWMALFLAAKSCPRCHPWRIVLIFQDKDMDMCVDWGCWPCWSCTSNNAHIYFMCAKSKTIAKFQEFIAANKHMELCACFALIMVVNTNPQPFRGYCMQRALYMTQHQSTPLNTMI